MNLFRKFTRLKHGLGRSESFRALHKACLDMGFSLVEQDAHHGEGCLEYSREKDGKVEGLEISYEWINADEDEFGVQIYATAQNGFTFNVDDLLRCWPDAEERKKVETEKSRNYLKAVLAFIADKDDEIFLPSKALMDQYKKYGFGHP